MPPVLPPRKSRLNRVRSGRRTSRSDKLSVYQFAAALGGLGLLQTVPAFYRTGIVGAPAWAKCAVALGFLQLAYAVWVALAPDWGTVWVATLVCAAVTALYALVLAAAMFTPPAEPMILGLDSLRREARLWCGAIALLTLLLTYLGGRFSTRWHRRRGTL